MIVIWIGVFQPCYFYAESLMADDTTTLAYQADLDAQRRLAECYRDGCVGLASTPMLGCAWRIVIAASGHSRLTQADFDRRQRDCESLGTADQSAAVREAKAIFLKVYGKDLALPADFFGGNRPSRR